MSRLVAFAAVLASARFGHGQAVIEGRVALRPEAPVPVSRPRYPVAASYTVGPPDPPAAVVYLEDDFPAPRAPASVQVAQQHYQFAPGLLPVRRGSFVTFPNLDDEYHSVFSYSKAKRFDLGRYDRNDTPAELVFDEAGVVRIFCEIHDHMRGTILVLDTPYFVKTDAEGRYRLDEVPTGSYVIRAWINEDTVPSRAMELRPGATLQVDFE